MSQPSERFLSAALYSASDDERFTAETWEEAVSEWLERWMPNDTEDWTVEEAEQMLREACEGDHGIVVGAYNPLTVHDDERQRWALYLTETLQEYFEEEYGDPEEWPDKPDDHAVSVMRGAVDAVVSKWHVFRCEQVATWRAPFEKVLSIAQQDPYWPSRRES